LHIASPTEEVSNQAPVPQSATAGREKHRHGKQGARISGPSTLKRWKREARTKYTNVETTSAAEQKLRKRKGDGGESETGQHGEEKKRQKGSRVLSDVDEQMAAAVEQPRQKP
jgi:hypothetical protein